MRDGQRGQLDVVRDALGLPLIVPIAIGIAGFREAVGDQHGRYRLDALDADKMQIDGAEPAYVSVPQPRKVIEIEAGEPVTDPDLEHDQAVVRDVAPVAGLRNAAPVPRMVAPPAVVAAPMVGSPIGTWPALPMPVAMTGEQYLVGEALRGLVQINRQQGDAHAQQLGQLSAMASSTLAAIPPLLLATTAHAERVETLLAELLLRQSGITPPIPPPPVAPPPPAPPPTPPAPTIVYAMPRNAAFADEEYDDEDGEDDDLDDEAPIAKDEEDFFAKANKLVATVGQAIAPVAAVAQMVMSAGLGGLGGLFGGGDSPRNAAPPADTAPPADEPGDDDQAEAEIVEPTHAHLRISHVLAVSHELGVKDGSIFRHMIRAMEPADRQMFTARLCAMPLDEAVPFAAEKVAWLKARLARSRARCAEPAERVRADQEQHNTVQHEPDLDTDQAEQSDIDPDQEHDPTTQHDDSLAPDQADLAPDQEHDPTQHDDHFAPDPSHLDDQEHERAAHLDSLAADTHVPTGDEPAIDAPAAVELPTAPAALTPTTHPDRRHMPTASTPATTVATAPEVPRPVTPDVMAHMKLIAKHLRFPEILKTQALINSTSVAERNGWIARLMALDPAEAATVVRAELARRDG